MGSKTFNSFLILFIFVSAQKIIAIVCELLTVTVKHAVSLNFEFEFIKITNFAAKS